MQFVKGLKGKVVKSRSKYNWLNLAEGDGYLVTTAKEAARAQVNGFHWKVSVRYKKVGKNKYAVWLDKKLRRSLRA